MSLVGQKDLGINLTLTHTAAQHTLGQRIETSDGGEYVYVVAGGTITAQAPVKIATGWSATISGNGGLVDAVAHVDIASGSYGFVQTRGVAVVDAATDVDAGDLVAWVSDASGRVKEVVSTAAVDAIDEAGAATHTAIAAIAAAALAPRGRGLVNEAANVATIRLF